MLAYELCHSGRYEFQLWVQVKMCCAWFSVWIVPISSLFYLVYVTVSNFILDDHHQCCSCLVLMLTPIMVGFQVGVHLHVIFFFLGEMIYMSTNFMFNVDCD